MAHTFDIKAARKEVWKITAYLTILTVIELILGFTMMNWPEDSGKRHAVKALILILMVWKAFYIVAYFMHLKHEVKNFVTTILVPLSLFIWFIIAFLGDGNSYKELRHKYDPYHTVRSEQKMEVKEEGHEGATHEAPAQQEKKPGLE